MLVVTPTLRTFTVSSPVLYLGESWFKYCSGHYNMYVSVFFAVCVRLCIGKVKK